MLNIAFAAPGLEGIQVYQKNLQHDERHQAVTDDISRYYHADNLWDVLRQEFVLPHYEDNPLVQEQIQWFMQHQDFLLNSTRRAIPYLYYIIQQVHKRHLPAEVALLPIFESAYDPYAYSTAGAAGIWQMMPGTASGYGIKQNWWYDGRRDVIVSTKAALNHLSYLANFFQNNWLLAIAAYDTGQGNVISAINKNIRDGYNTNYWYLPLARETRIYVPRLLALATILANPDKYPVYFPPVRNAPYLAQVDVGTQIDLKRAAMLAGLTIKKLLQLNPGYNRMITDPTGPYKLVLPIENVEQFSENSGQIAIYPHSIHWLHYKVKAGDTLFSIAKRFKSSTTSLRKLNRLTSNRLRPGSSLVLPHYVTTSKIVPTSVYQALASAENLPSKSVQVTHPQNIVHTAAYQTPNGDNYVIQPGDTIYMPRAGDSVEKIAKHFQITSGELLAANPTSYTQHLSADQRLVIPTHLNINRSPKYEMTPGDTIYMVRDGDTMEGIAEKFHITAPEIRIINMIADGDLREGDRLVIPTHAKA